MRRFMLALVVLLWGSAGFAQAPKATLEQARNGTASSPTSPVVFQTGNLGSSNSHYVEGMSAPYRLVLENISLGAHNVIIEWDIKNGGAHAIDYITHYDRLQPHNFSPSHAQEVVDPLNGLTGPFSGPSTFAIPAPSSAGSPVAGQPTADFNALPAGERNMTIWNGSISSLSYVNQGSLTAAQSASSISIDFTATSSTVVIAWGGHLASRLVWGDGNSAGGISGSPFHMRLLEFDGSGGNQDRSMQAAAVAPTPLADLSLVKSVSNPTPLVGSTVTFTIAVTNSGPDAATNVSVADVIPSGYTYVAGSIAGGTSRTAAAPNLSWTIASLANGATTNLTFQAVVNATGNYLNVAQVTASDQEDPDSTPNNENGAPYEDDEDDATVVPTPVADLSLLKSVNNPTANVGSTVTFTIAVTNNGPSTATNVSVGDVIPSGFTYVTGSIAGGTSRTAAAPNLSWTIASLANGASTNLTFQAVVNATGNYTNVAQVTASDQNDPDSTPNNENGTPYEDDEDDATVVPTAVADLSLLKSVDNPTANVGSTVTFTIAVTNNGPSTATNVSVGDVIPSGFTYVTGSIAGGTSRSAAGAPTLTWTIASLANGATTNLSFQAVVNATGNYTNVAEVTASDQNDPDSQPDPTPDNDTPTQDDEDSETVTPTPVADLSLVKTVNNPTATVGSTVTFTIAVTNNGPSTATNVSVGDVIPSGFTYVTGSIAGGTSRSAAGAPTLTWTIASLANGATTNLSFQAVVNATGNYTNVAEVTASDQIDPDSQPDPTPDNDPPTQDDEGAATVTPTAVADLSLVKSVNNPTANVGSTVTFTIAVTNNGPSTATNVSIGDVIPSGFTYVTGSIAGGTSRSDASAPTLSWTIASLASGATTNLTFQAVVNATGNYTNVAEVTASDQNDSDSQPDPTPDNDTPTQDDEGAATVTPTAVADLSLVKSVNNPTATVGSTVTFTIAVTNNGPSTATNVSVGDVIPSGFTYVTGSIAGGTSRSAAGAPTLTWTIASLANGATTNLSFQAVVNATGNYTNVAEVTASDQNDPDSAPNNENGAPYEDDEDDATVSPSAVSDLSLVKTVNDPTANVGSTVTFTIAVTNNGPSTATNVSVGDVIPSGFTYVTGSIAGGTSRTAAAPNLSWTIASLANGASTNLTFQAVVNATGNYTNVAQVTASDQPDPDSAPNNENGAPYEDDEDDATVSPSAVSDLSLVKTVNNPTANVGSTVTFTIAVTNNGPSTATNVSVGDVIPSGFTYVTGSIAGGTSRTAAAPNLSWTIASLANGVTTNLTYQAVVNATGNYTNVAQVTASDQPDPDSAPNNENGAPYEDDEDDATVSPSAVSDLSLVKTVNNPTANVGSTVTFTIAVTNNGPSTATNVSVGDVIPSGFTYVTGSIAGGTSRSDATAPTLTWTIASLANGASTNLTFQAVVNATGSYTNVAQVTASDQPDPDSAPNNENGTPYEDDEDDATVVPTAVADLSLVKTVNNPTANVGSTVTFTIAVTNNGPSTATNVSVGDVIPSGFTYVTGSIAGGTSRSAAGAPTLTWTIASLANGATTNLSFQAVVNATGNYTNVAEVTASDQNDPDSAPNNENGAPYEDDEDDATVSPSAVSDLSLVKTVNDPTANVGSTVTFTIAVTNNGPSTATNVSVGDVIPSGFTYVTGSIAGGTSRSAAGAPTLTWTIASLANGVTTNLTYQAVVNATGNYKNVAQVTASDQPDPDSAPNNENGAPYEDDEDDATVTPQAVADLSLQKSVNNPTATVGSTVTFTIAVTNNGPSTATNVSVGDVIPSGFTYVAGSIAGGTSRSAAGAPTLTWTIAGLANGVTTNLTYQAVVNATGNYKNVAQVTASDQPDPDSAPNNENGAPYEDDEDDATVTPQAVADLSLQKSVNNPTATVGSTVTFTIAVTNNGPSTATNVSVGDVIPSGFTYVAGSIAGGTSRSAAGAPTLTWTIAGLANGVTTNLTYQAVVNATGNYKNVAQVTASDQPDPDSAPNNENGAPYEDDEDDATVTPQAVADLSLQKSVNNPTATVGSTVTFTIAVTNNGPSTATNVSVGDVIPSGFTYVTGSIAGGTSRTAAAPNLSWTIASLANGASTNLTFQAVVNATGSYTNVAQVTASDQPDPDSAPNNENGAPYEDDEDDATVTPSSGCENSYLYVISDEDYNQLSRVKLDGQSSTLTVVANQIIYDGPMPGTPLLSGFTVGKPIGDDTESATFHPTPGKAFIISNLKTVSALFVLDLHTGRAKSVGYTRTSLGVGVDDINGLAYNRNDGYLYGVTVNGDRLVKINPSNARVVKLYSSAIASSGNPDFEGLEFDYSVSPPVLYAISEYGSGQIYRVNLTTGVGTQVGSTMLGMESIAFSEQDGTIYASNNNGGLYVLDRTTFAATKYANTLVIDGEGIVLEECVDQLVKGAVQEGGLATAAAVPENYALQQNYPNPFNPTTLIHFDLPEAGQVKLTVYDAMGRLVRTLVSEHRPAGSYEILWDATDEQGTRVASGVYLYRLEVNDFTAVRRMLMLK
ncbi:MAG: hypothetical protein DKINENOH_05177 [bacterium]|nr:hypothetical protein [bacterium]